MQTRSILRRQLIVPVLVLLSFAGGKQLAETVPGLGVRPAAAQSAEYISPGCPNMFCYSVRLCQFRGNHRCYLTEESCTVYECQKLVP